MIGATSGVAQALCEEFLMRGKEIVLAARNQEKLKCLISNLETRYDISPLSHYNFDIGQIKDHKEFFQRVIQAHPDVDGIFVACAVNHDQKKCESDTTLVEEMVRINFTGTMTIIDLFADYFSSKNGGMISCITSVAGDRGRASNYYYGATKSALNAYLSGLRNRLARTNVFVQTIKLGTVDTPMNSNREQVPLMVKPVRAARGIMRSMQKRYEVVYIPWFWCYIMLVIRLMPEKLFKRIAF